MPSLRFPEQKRTYTRKRRPKDLCVNTHVCTDDYNELYRLKEAAGLTMSGYVRWVLKKHIRTQTGREYADEEIVETPENDGQ